MVSLLIDEMTQEAGRMNQMISQTLLLERIDETLRPAVERGDKWLWRHSTGTESLVMGMLVVLTFDLISTKSLRPLTLSNEPGL